MLSRKRNLAGKRRNENSNKNSVEWENFKKIKTIYANFSTLDLEQARVQRELKAPVVENGGENAGALVPPVAQDSVVAAAGDPAMADEEPMELGK
jgi:hypothetical protein